MENINDNDLFWKIMARNRGKTIIIDLPKEWVKITVNNNGAIGTEVGNTLRDVKVTESQFENFKDSNNLKLALTDVFENSSFKKAFVIENEKLEENLEVN